jgi:rod shape-determining protein MreD
MNKQIWKYILLFVIALLFQITFIRFIEILHWKPDLILIVLVIFSIEFGPNFGSTSGFISGLAGDLVSSHLIGLGALSKSITGYLSANLSRFFRERGQFILTLAISGLVHNLIYFFISTLGSDFSWHIIIFLYIIPNLFYTTIVGFFVYYFLINWLKGE